MESAATGSAAHPPGASDPPQNCGGYMSLVGHWEEAKFPAGINLVQTMAPGWRQIVSEVALDLITIPAVSALALSALPMLLRLPLKLAQLWRKLAREK